MAKAAKPPLRSGRQARLIERAAPPAINPCPPGQRGGQYRPLSDGDMAAIYSASLRLLAELGMGKVPDRLAALMLANGAKQADGRVLLPDQLVKSAIRAAPKRFDFHGRDASRTIEVGGDAVHFGTAGAAVQTLDLETGSYRPSTLADLHDFARLQDALTNISWFTRCCIATDVTDPFELDVNTAYALIKNTTRPVGTAFTLAAHVAPIVRMLDIAAGGMADLPHARFSKPISARSYRRCALAPTRLMLYLPVSNTTSRCRASPPPRPGRPLRRRWPDFWRSHWQKRWPLW